MRLAGVPLLCALIVGPATDGVRAQTTHHTDPIDLAIGDPTRKERRVDIGIDRIVDSPEHLTMFKAYFDTEDASHNAGLTDATWRDWGDVAELHIQHGTERRTLRITFCR